MGRLSTAGRWTPFFFQTLRRSDVAALCSKLGKIRFVFAV
jgi:hypothetical protein